MTDKKIIVAHGFAGLTPIGINGGAEQIWIKLSEIVSMLAYDDSTMLTMADGSIQNVTEFVANIFEAMEEMGIKK